MLRMGNMKPLNTKHGVVTKKEDSSLLGVGCDESQEVLMGVGKHGEQGADGIPAPLTPALAWRSSRIPAEPYPPASNSIVSGMTLAVKR